MEAENTESRATTTPAERRVLKRLRARGARFLGSRHFLREVRPQVSPETFEALRAARWRLKNGLESRALQAMLYSAEVRAVARVSLTPADFLTPPYAALAAVVVQEPEGSPVLERALASIARRPYVPDARAGGWTVDGLAVVAQMVKRRERWEREMAQATTPPDSRRSADVAP
jgi:hypothetical protein